MSITLVGDVFCDIVASNLTELPRWGEDSLCSNISIVAGGSLLNSAVHGANYSSFREAGIRLNAFGVVGRDVQGDICLKAIQGQSLINNEILVVTEHPTGTCIVLSGSQDRLFITNRGCIETTTLELFKDKFFLNDSSHIHAAGFYNFTHPVRAAWIDVFRSAKERGLTTSLNPQYDASGMWTDIKELCPHLDFLITNEIELSSITNQPTHREGAEIVSSWGCKCIVVTNSEGATAFVHGSYLSKDNNAQVNDIHLTEITTSEPVKLVEIKQSSCSAEVQDTCGAGDAFAGAFLVEYLRSKGNLAISLQAGCIAGTAAVQLVGGSSVPSIELMTSTSILTTLP